MVLKCYLKVTLLKRCFWESSKVFCTLTENVSISTLYLVVVGEGRYFILLWQSKKNQHLLCNCSWLPLTQFWQIAWCLQSWPCKSQDHRTCFDCLNSWPFEFQAFASNTKSPLYRCWTGLAWNRRENCSLNSQEWNEVAGLMLSRLQTNHD